MPTLDDRVSEHRDDMAQPTRQEPERRAPQGHLERQYRAIGIPAVAAAARYRDTPGTPGGATAARPGWRTRP